MKTSEVGRGLLTAMLPLFFLLLSYQLVLTFYPLTIGQEEGLRFAGGEEGLKLNYTAAETSHLHDVAKLMRVVDFIFYLSGAVVVWFIVHSWKKKEQLESFLKYGGIATVGLLVLFFIAMIFGFELVFRLFHLLFFPQGNWVFPADSLLIKTFPFDFFTKISFTIALLALALGSLFILLSFYLQHAARTPRN